jgi:hypothetical protein
MAILPHNATAPTRPSCRREQQCKTLWKRVVGRQSKSDTGFGNVENSTKAEGSTVANVDPSGTTVMFARILAQFRPVSVCANDDHHHPIGNSYYGRADWLNFRSLARGLLCRWGEPASAIVCAHDGSRIEDNSKVRSYICRVISLTSRSSPKRVGMQSSSLGTTGMSSE